MQQQQQQSQQKRKVFRGSALFGKTNNQPPDGEDLLQRTLRISRIEKGGSGQNPPQEGGHRRSASAGSLDAGRLKYKPSDVKQLERMGFSREQAVQALIENDNHLHRAADALLSSR